MSNTDELSEFQTINVQNIVFGELYRGNYNTFIPIGIVDQESIEDNNESTNDFNNYIDTSYSYGVGSSNSNSNSRIPPSRAPPSKSNVFSRNSFTQTHTTPSPSHNLQGHKFQDNTNYQNLYNFTTSELDNQNNFNPPNNFNQNSFNQANNVNSESIYNLISNVDPNSTVDDYEAVSLPEGGPSPFIDGFVYSSY